MGFGPSHRHHLSPESAGREGRVWQCPCCSSWINLLLLVFPPSNLRAMRWKTRKHSRGILASLLDVYSYDLMDMSVTLRPLVRNQSLPPTLSSTNDDDTTC